MRKENKHGIIGAIALPVFIFCLSLYFAGWEIATRSLTGMWHHYLAFILGGFVMGKFMLKITTPTPNTRLERIDVCDRCFSMNIVNPDCICVVGNKYKQITLEFEVCSCCGEIIEDGYPADTEFNIKQLNKLKQRKK